jgi:WhiB family transcriptional regulator, redox-sensing transcriptional regulator
MAAGPSSMSDNAARGVRAREEEGGVSLMSDTSQGLLQRQRDAEDTDWRDHAACGDADPDLFFPIGTAGESLLQIDEARQICRACPVCGPCLLVSGAERPRTSGASSGARSRCGRAGGRAARRGVRRPGVVGGRKVGCADLSPSYLLPVRAGMAGIVAAQAVGDGVGQMSVARARVSPAMVNPR